MSLRSSGLRFSTRFEATSTGLSPSPPPPTLAAGGAGEAGGGGCEKRRAREEGGVRGPGADRAPPPPPPPPAIRFANGRRGTRRDRRFAPSPAGAPLGPCVSRLTCGSRLNCGGFAEPL